MRITIQVLIETGADRAPRTETLSTIERDAECAPVSGLGLFMGETHEILRKLQAVVLREDVAQLIDRVARCMRCRLPLGVKDSKTVVYRTAFGKARLDSPRFYSACSRCRMPARTRHSVSPLAEQLPERVHPQWLWLQSRYAATTPSQPGGRWPCRASKEMPGASGSGLISKPSSAPRPASTPGRTGSWRRPPACPIWRCRSMPATSGPPPTRTAHAGLGRSSPSWLRARRGYTHAYAGTYDPHQGVRQQAFFTSVGVPHDAPMTVLADGGEDVLHACMLPQPTERVRDWFHIAMRFEHPLTALRGLRHVQPDVKAALGERAEGAKWLLWHGRSVRCLARLEALRRDTGWAGVRNPLGRLIQHLRGFAERLIDYARRYGQHRPIATSVAESAVNSVIGERMKKRARCAGAEPVPTRCCSCAARCSTGSMCATSSAGTRRASV